MWISLLVVVMLTAIACLLYLLANQLLDRFYAQVGAGGFGLLTTLWLGLSLGFAKETGIAALLCVLVATVIFLNRSFHWW